VDPVVTTKIVAAVLGCVLSAPMLIACVRAIAFFGEMKKMLEVVSESIRTLTEKQGEHGERISAVEAEVEGLRSAAQGQPQVGSYRPPTTRPA
jgi:hypothetical protein